MRVSDADTPSAGILVADEILSVQVDTVIAGTFLLQLRDAHDTDASAASALAQATLVRLQRVTAR